MNLYWEFHVVGFQMTATDTARSDAHQKTLPFCFRERCFPYMWFAAQAQSYIDVNEPVLGFYLVHLIIAIHIVCLVRTVAFTYILSIYIYIYA